MKRNFKGKDVFGQWTLLKSLDSGGNGEVWIAGNEKEKVALKLCKKDGEIPNQRFRDEVKAIIDCQKINGVIKILDYNLPEDYKNEVAYFAMPIGQPVKFVAQKMQNFDLYHDIDGEYITSLKNRINLICELSQTLVEIHNLSIYHRDIKPSNVLLLNEKPLFIDFGLATFPNKTKVSKLNEKIGPFSTMPPEVNRRMDSINFEKADVYSFAKTCWMILTGDYIGFEGQYSRRSIISLERYFPDFYTTTFDELLTDATSNDIDNRPTSIEFYKRISSWRNAVEDFHIYNRNQWNESIDSMFPISIPRRVEWKEIDEIIKVLSFLSSVKNMNHTMFPESGGLDLKGIKLAGEDGFIELDFGLKYIMKPKHLMFESFNSDYEWFYFRLEAEHVEATGIDDRLRKDATFEYLSEIEPGVYDNYTYLEHWYDRDEEGEYPEGARTINRILKGSFVIFNKRSSYNLDGRTYDGRHNKMDADEFRTYIQKNIMHTIE